jgi:hypothetical protein
MGSARKCNRLSVATGVVNRKLESQEKYITFLGCIGWEVRRR